MKNYVIIGGGVASIGCIEGIRSVDKKGRITLISGEKRPTYCRPLISYYLEGKTTLEKMKYRPDSFYSESDVNIVFDKAEKINVEEKTVKCGNKSINYDSLLVATGSDPFVPPFSGLEKVEKKFSFMTEDDALSLEKELAPDKKVLIVGAGLIGLKCAEGIAERVEKITVCDLATRVLSSILDDTCAAFMQKKLEENGVKFLLGDTAVSFDRNSALMKSGKTVDFDILILAVGVKANVYLLKDIGANVDRGVIVDTKMQTSIENVYAAGDCAQGYDSSINANRVLAILPSAYMQGFTAGVNMAGGEKVFDNSIPMNAIGFFGYHALTAGAYRGEVYEEKTENGIKRLFIENGYLVGFMLIGEISRAGIYTSLIREKTPLAEVNTDIMKNSPKLAIFDKKIRAKKLGGVV